MKKILALLNQNKAKENKSELEEINPIDLLPTDVLMYIFQQGFSLNDLLKFLLVSKKWKQTADAIINRDPSWLNKIAPQKNKITPAEARKIFITTEKQISGKEKGTFFENLFSGEKTLLDVFTKALIDGNINVVARLLDKGAAINGFTNFWVLATEFSAEKRYLYPLMLAAKKDHYELVEFLLKAGADVNQVYFSHWESTQEIYPDAIYHAIPHSKVQALLYVARLEKEMKNQNLGTAKFIFNDAWLYSNREYIQQYLNDINTNKKGLLIDFSNNDLERMNTWFQEFIKQQQPNEDKTCQAVTLRKS